MFFIADSLPTLTNIPGDRTFCISPNKIAITFCILGLVFLCAVVVAACALLRARRATVGTPYYTRSIFSSSSGGSGYGGSKLLLHESPCLGQVSSRHFPYGKMYWLSFTKAYKLVFSSFMLKFKNLKYHKFLLEVLKDEAI